MPRFLASIGLLAVGTSCLPAADVEKPDITALVQKLGDPRFQDREQAARDLIALGGAALPAVREAINTTPDPGLRDRAETLLPRLELLAESQRYLTPKLVKLDYQNVPLVQVVEDLKKKTGIPLMLLPKQVANLDRPITLTGGETPVWEAIDKLCEVARLKEDHRANLPVPGNESANGSPAQGYAQAVGGQLIYVNSYGPAPQTYTTQTAPVLLIDGKADLLPGVRTTPIRVLALPGSFEANRTMRGAGTVTIHLDVAPAGGVNWQGGTHVRVTRAEDEDGRPLYADQKSDTTFEQPGMPGMIRGGGLVMWNSINNMPFAEQVIGNNPRLTPVTLRTDDRAIKRLKHFEGVVVGEVHIPNVPVISIDDMSQVVGKVYRQGNMEFSITDFKPQTDGGVRLKIHAEMPNGWMMQARALRLARNFNSDQITNIVGRLKFADADGNSCESPLQRSSSTTFSQWKQTYDGELVFRKSRSTGPAVKVVLVGTKVVTVEVPFTMENVRLP